MTIQTPVKTRVVNGHTEVMVQVNHPAQTGHKPDHPRDTSGADNGIETVVIRQNELAVAEIYIGPDVSPRLITSIALADANKGDRIRVEWRDNEGLRGEGETRVS